MPLPEFRNTFGKWEVHRSALKHGVSAEDAVHAAERVLISFPLQEEDEEGPLRELLLGPDTSGNLLEIVALIRDEEPVLIIHAMRMRPKYRSLLP